MTEFHQKQDRIQQLLRERGLEALLLQRVSSFAWATCGAASYVNTASTMGEAALLITPAGLFLIANNIEATRLRQEEEFERQGWEFRIAPWYEAHDTIADLTRDLKLGSDGPFAGAKDLSGEVSRLRANLTPEEGDRFRVLGRVCGKAMDEAARAVRPGHTEYEVAGLLAREAERRGIQGIVNLIASDERVFNFRHPLPTQKEVNRYVMLVLCGRWKGLVCSLTRFVHFGPPPGELLEKAEAVAQIDAVMIAATRPGKSLGEIFQLTQAAYADAGFAEEWQLHHQGGPAGYEPREYLALPDAPEKVRLYQAYAWNPSITGTKSEDTILVGESENEILTRIDDWPTQTIEVDGELIRRPIILEL
jgi:Xaa-Pro aminopeptidase